MGDTWDKVKGIISGAAPLVGTLVGGPAGGTVGTLISSALGVDDSPDAIEMELRNNPDALLKIKELEITHKTRFEEMALEETRAHLADTQDARRAEIERMKSGGDNRFMYALATIIVIGFFGVIAGLYFKAIPKESRDVALVLLGTLASEFGVIVKYFFGSSKGSSDKTKMLMNGK